MRRISRVLAVLFAVGAAACPGLPLPTNGQAFYDGGISGSTYVVVSAASSAEGVTFLATSPANIYPSFSFVGQLPGPALEAITYDDSVVLSANTLVREEATGGVVWTQLFTPAASVGAFVLIINDPGDAGAGDGGVVWEAPHGQLLTTLLPLGDITDAGIWVTVTF